ncbi:unnamed protein product [Arctia plantaginis]|uniref:Uncharacterized protein n=1 Tax=Arctia plantaginis TaxID=874455 RepID=A0A8S0ZKG4_ARCPL|nr:unnamed protein product [Arctia plantaginis]CAB3238395.1 unnamed protein product [Arctia plantaginis]
MVSAYLYKSTLELRIAVSFFKSLLDVLLSLQELFDDYDTKANEASDTENSDENQRVRRRKRHHFDGSADKIVTKEEDKLNIHISLS